jgi:WD40 repeat protein
MEDHRPTSTSRLPLSVIILVCIVAGSSARGASAGGPQVLAGHTDLVKCVCFSPDGTMLASGSFAGEGAIRLWDLKTGKVLRTLVPSDSLIWRRNVYSAGQKGNTSSIAFSPDGTTLAVLFDFVGNQIALYDTKTWKQRTQIVVDESAPSSGFRSPPLGFGMGGGGGSESGQPCYCVAFSPDGKLVATGGGLRAAPIDDRVRAWDMKGRVRLTLRGHAHGVAGIGFLPTFNAPSTKKMQTASVVTADRAGVIRLWTAQGKRLGEWNVEHYFANRPPETLYVLDCMAVSPDGKTVALGGREGNPSLWLWDVETRKMRHAVGNLKGHIISLAFAGNDNALVCSQWWSVVVWDVAANKLIAKIEDKKGGAGIASFLAVAPDGKTLAVGSDKTIKLLKVGSDKTVGGHNPIMEE